nr:olfactory receptor 77 [Tropidothorax elegans]
MADRLSGPIRDPYQADLIWLLKFGGLWFQKFPGRLGSCIPYLQVLRSLMVVVIELVVGIAALRIGPEFFLNPSSGFLTLGLVVVVMSIPFTFGHSRLLAFLSALESGHSRLQMDWQHRRLKEEYARSYKLVLFYIFYTLSFTIAFPLIGFSIDTFHSILGKEIYRYPLVMDIFDTDSERTLKHFAVVLLSYVWVNLIATQNVSVIGTMFITTAFIKGRLRILEDMLERLPAGNVWNMREIVSFHQEIIRIHHMYTELLGFPFASQSILGGINSCLIGTCIFYLYRHGATVMFLLLLSYFINFQALLLLTGLEGETLQTQNEQMSYQIYNLKWYEQKPDVRRAILMMIRQAQKPLRLDYKGNAPLNLKTYAQTISTAYSYFNLYLKSVRDI